MISHEAEAARLESLRAYDVLDSGPERGFDRITALAADLFDAPIALVSLVDESRQWFKSRVGLDVAETPRSLAFCDHTIRQDSPGVLVVEDATLDERFRSNDLVQGAPHIRFYAGAKLTTPDGHNLGSLCVIDTKPRARPSDRQMKQLTTLASLVVDELELRRAHRLSESRHELLSLAEAMSSVGRWRYSPANGHVLWSDEVYRIHGVTKDTFDPNLDQAIEFYHPDDRPQVSALLDRALAEGIGFAFQLRLLRRDGELRFVSSKASAVRGETGEVREIIGVFQDITETVRMVEALRDSEARYRQLADTASDIIVRVGRDGLIHYASPSLRTLGYEPEEAVGRPILDFAAPASLEDARKAQESNFAGLPVRREFRARARDGREIWLEGNPSPVRDAAGQVVENISIFRDITKRKELEEQLRAAREAAEAAAAVKGEFLANMSHELRTPLTSILGFSRLVLEHPDLPAGAGAHMARVLAAGDALLVTINDILDFSKLEAGQVEIRPTAASLADVTSEAVALFEAAARPKGLELSLSCRDVPEACLFDVSRVRQVLLNLVGNAVKFTDSGKVSVSVSYRRSDRLAEFRIADTGPGISHQNQANLFQRFSQVDGTATRRHGGTGLGLAISKGLVEAMGGAIGVESREGRGSCFWFTISAPVAVMTQPDTGQDTLVSGTRVLLAEDNEVNRKLIRAYLDPLGVEVCEARNGLEAVALAAQRPFDVILMDLRMPKLDGRDAAARIRRGGHLNDRTPIFAFSADRFADADAALFDGLVEKPVARDSLCAVVAGAISLRAAA